MDSFMQMRIPNPNSIHQFAPYHLHSKWILRVSLSCQLVPSLQRILESRNSSNNHLLFIAVYKQFHMRQKIHPHQLNVKIKLSAIAQPAQDLSNSRFDIHTIICQQTQQSLNHHWLIVNRSNPVWPLLQNYINVLTGISADQALLAKQHVTETLQQIELQQFVHDFIASCHQFVDNSHQGSDDSMATLYLQYFNNLLIQIGLHNVVGLSFIWVAVIRDGPAAIDHRVFIVNPAFCHDPAQHSDNISNFFVLWMRIASAESGKRPSNMPSQQSVIKCLQVFDHNWSHSKIKQFIAIYCKIRSSAADEINDLFEEVDISGEEVLYHDGQEVEVNQEPNFIKIAWL